MPGQPDRDGTGDGGHHGGRRDAQKKGRPQTETELADPDRHAIHAESEIERLTEGEQPDITEQQVDAGRQQRPDQDFRDHIDPEHAAELFQQNRRKAEADGDDRDAHPFDALRRHRVAPANSPLGLTSKTTHITASEVIRAKVGSAKLEIRPSSTASRTAAATVPFRFPSPPMTTAMKLTGRMSTPVRNSAVVIGAAIAPPRSAIAVPR